MLGGLPFAVILVGGLFVGAAGVWTWDHYFGKARRR